MTGLNVYDSSMSYGLMLYVYTRGFHIKVTVNCLEYRRPIFYGTRENINPCQSSYIEAAEMTARTYVRCMETRDKFICPSFKLWNNHVDYGTT